MVVWTDCCINVVVVVIVIDVVKIYLPTFLK